MTSRIGELLAGPADALVREHFTGVEARWWWERRLEGGIVVCQELDLRVMAREVAECTGRDAAEVRRVIEEELDVEGDEPVVLTFELPDDATAEEAARRLSERSSDPRGLAAGLYRRVERSARR